MSGQKGGVDLHLLPRPENPSIHRVNDLLRSTNELAYDPRIVAIGPFHRDKQHLNNMEQEKKRYLEQLLRSRNEPSVDRYVQKIRDLQDRARQCYSEPIALGNDEFVSMLLLDGIFIVEFLRKYKSKMVIATAADDDAIFQFGHVIRHVLHDLVLLENQIPFFIVEEVFGLTKAHHDQAEIGELIEPLVLQNAMSACTSMQNVSAADHLLALVHKVNCYSFHQILSPQRDNDRLLENINSATELKEAGVRFKKIDNEKSASWLDVRFKNKKIYIPVLEVSDVTESWFRNMIAYEYYLPRNDPKYFTDYTFLMHCLIHAPRDAQLLRRYGIISNWLGGDEMVYHLVNQLGTNVLTSENFSYLDVFYDVNRHCKRRRNRWIAILRRDYFNSPWKLISLVAGVVLLGVGIVQMVFAILSYHNDTKKGH